MSGLGARARRSYTRSVAEPIRFTVTSVGIRDTRRLQQRHLISWAVPGLAAAGLVLVLSGNSGGLVLVAIGVLMFLEWRYPIFDRWFDRRRLILGSECEVWLDESGLRFHQAGGEAFDVSGQFNWSRISGLLEDDRAVLVVDGRVGRIGIPKEAFASAESLAAFRAEIHQRVAEQRPGSRSSGR
jgi:hypothetical protein